MGKDGISQRSYQEDKGNSEEAGEIPQLRWERTKEARTLHKTDCGEKIENPDMKSHWESQHINEQICSN